METPIAYMSKKFNTAQYNYSTTELECYAAVLALKKLRAYVGCLPLMIITEHMSLKWRMNQQDLCGRLTRWSLELQNFL